jgi:tetratricopeptide (TPR) repeat protein
MVEGVGLLQQAVTRDSGFAAGWGELARALLWAHRFGFRVPGVHSDSLLPAALAASERSLLLDSTDVDAWALRATVARAVDPTSNGVAIAAFRRALALDSANASTWRTFAQVLDESGDSAGAAAAFRRAWALEPDRPPAMLVYHLYWYGRRLDTAAVIAARVVESDPRHMFYRELQGEIAFARGRPGEAQAAYEAALRLGDGREQVRALGGLAVVTVGLGDTARARDLVARAEAFVRASEFTVHDAIALAGACAALGETSRALDWLERYQPVADLHFRSHLRDMPLDPLRAEPRFQRLLGSSPR